MIIHHTRTNLLLLREKASSVVNSISILRARRQALIREFLSTSLPYLRTKKEIADTYARALDELALCRGHMGRSGLESIASAAGRDMPVAVTEKSIWGLRYKDVKIQDEPVRDADARGYYIPTTTLHLEACINNFEKILKAMIEIASFESKLKRLGDEITRITRKIKVLEERTLPDVKYQIRNISQYLGEREREAYFRLKRFKELHAEV